METKLNTGAIFKNDKKASDKHPDYRGKINVDGKDKDISLWLNTSEKGTKYFSVKISEVWKPKEGAAGTTANPVVTNATTDDLPF